MDLLALFDSFCHSLGGSARIEKVQVYPSLYGLEQMKKDSLYGPPAEMFKSAKRAAKSEKHNEKHEYISDDDFKLNENEEGENMA